MRSAYSRAVIVPRVCFSLWATGLILIVFPLAAARAQESVLRPVQTLRDTLPDEPTWVTVSPDGVHVYVVDSNKAQVSAFARNAIDGSLTWIQTVAEGVDDISGLSGAQHLVFSADGATAYIPGFFSNAVAVFARDAGTGVLTPIETLFDGVNGALGLGGAEAVAVSADGEFVYVAGSVDSVAQYRRASDGTLTFIEVEFNGTLGVTGLGQPTDVVVSPDGKQIYLPGATSNSVCVFSVDVMNGTMAFLESHFEGVNGVSGIAAPSSIVMSADGAHLYVAGETGTVAMFSRNGITGELAFVESFSDGFSGVDGILGAKSLVLSPSGEQLYVSGSVDNGLANFSRSNDTGTLTFSEVLFDGAGGVDGLKGAYGIDVAPDGGHLYVASLTGRATAVFARDGSLGSLAFLTRDYNPSEGVDGLAGASAVAVSPDGAQIYTAAINDDSVAVFPRSMADGSLAFGSIARDIGAGGTVAGLDGAFAVAASPDGKNVYVGGFVADTLTVFTRDSGSGELTFLESHADGAMGVDGLDYPNAIVLSPDGTNLYVAGRFDDAVAVYSRSPDNGSLTFDGIEANGVSGVTGLDNPTSLALAPDGSSLYAACFDGNSVVIFSRNADTGALTFVDVQTDGISGIETLGGATSVVVSPDGSQVYVQAFFDNAINVFARDNLSGALSFQSSVTVDAGLTVGTGSSLLLSPDGRRVYSTSVSDHTIWVFDRNLATGDLVFLQSVYIGDLGSEAVASPDGGFVYAAVNSRDGLTALEVGVFASVSGYVAHVAEPVTCATVELANNDRSVVSRAVTDQNGYYFFDDVPPGAYAARVLAPGFGTAVDDTPVVVSPGEALVRHFFVAPEPLSGAITGTVTDGATGYPLPAVFVEARVNGQLLQTTYTCASGAYELNGLFGKGAATEVDVTFTLEDYETEQATVPVEPGGATEVNQAMAKSVNGPATLAGVVFAAMESGENSPLANAEVTLTGALHGSIHTDDNGLYLFPAVLDGTYTIHASATGYGGSTSVRTITGGSVTTVNFTLMAGTSDLPPLMNVSPLSRQTGSAPGGFLIAVTNGGSGTLQWSAAVTEGTTWLSASTGGVMGNGQVPVTYQANDTGTARNGTIRITPLNPGLSPVDVIVTQGRRGDVNGDGAANAVDVQIVINGALGLDTQGVNADVNGDGVVNAVDVQVVVNAALGL